MKLKVVREKNVIDLKKQKKLDFQKKVRNLKRCPSCGSQGLIKIHPDVLCDKCDWNSFQEYVGTGGMDRLEIAYLDHFGVPHNNDAKKTDQEGKKTEIHNDEVVAEVHDENECRIVVTA